MTQVPTAFQLALPLNIPVPRADLYAAWTTPDTLKRWFAMGPVAVTAAELDVRPGGALRLVVNDGAMEMSGEYLAVEPGRRLAFTWRRSGQTEPDSRVTLEFRDAPGGGTDLTLLHTELPAAEAVEHNRQGWTAILGNLAAEYTRAFDIAAPPASVLAALATPAGVAGWWTSDVTGDGAPGGTLRVGMGKSREARAELLVERADPESVVWRCTACHVADWVGTRIEFQLAPGSGGGTQLRFRHHGLTPALACYGICEPGWNHHLASLQAFAETGQKAPKVV